MSTKEKQQAAAAAESDDEGLIGSVDFLSADFDPDAALTDPSVVPPLPHVDPLDNVSMCKKLLPNYVAPNARKSESAKLQSEKYKHRALQPKLQAGETWKRFLASIHAKIHKDSPLACLKEAVRSGAPYKVWIRRRATMRSTLTGTIRAFDKHWNLIMADVLEEYAPPSHAPWESRGQASRTTWAGEIAAAAEALEKMDLGEKASPEPATSSLTAILDDDVPEYEETPSPEKRRPGRNPQKGEGGEEGDDAVAAAQPRKGKRREHEAKAQMPCRRRIGQMFVKGNGIVMVAPLNPPRKKAPRQGKGSAKEPMVSDGEEHRAAAAPSDGGQGGEAATTKAETALTNEGNDTDERAGELKANKEEASTDQDDLGTEEGECL